MAQDRSSAASRDVPTNKDKKGGDCIRHCSKGIITINNPAQQAKNPATMMDVQRGVCKTHVQRRCVNNANN